MAKSPIYEQVSGAHPGKPFVPSGLYRLAGYMTNKRFVAVTTPGPLRTMKQWRAMVGGVFPEETPMRWRCPTCLSYLPMQTDEHGQRKPCPQCGFHDVGPVADSTSYGMVAFEAPKTLDRVHALRQSPGQVAEYAPVAVAVQAVGAPQPRQTFPFHGETTERVLRLQVQSGQRAAPAPTLQAMHQLRCPRCQRTSCNCPPAPPRPLEAAVAQRKREIARQEAAFDAAGYGPAPRKA
jgi:hypothetical protein